MSRWDDDMDDCVRNRTDYRDTLAAEAPKRFESTGVSGDTSANIYESMLLSPAFKSLTVRQRLIYVIMKAQLYSKRKPKKDFPDLPEMQDDTLFYFNHAVMEKYALCNKNGSRVYKDIQAIIDAGFIERVSNGRANKRRSIYRYSDKWHLSH